MLRTVAVETHTLVLLKKLQQIPLLQDLRLVGGTALALQIGHRKSDDLDLFGSIETSGLFIEKELQDNDFEVSLKYDTKPIRTFFINQVKVDMVNYPFDWLDSLIDDEGVKMAGMRDIAAMKLAAITNRGTKKDFVDLHFLLQSFSLKEMFDFYTQKYVNVSLFMVIRSLTYFADAEKDEMPEMIIPTDWEKVKETIKKEVVKL